MTFLAAVSGTASIAAGRALSTGVGTVVNSGAGVLGFLVVASIGVALVFLLRSMNKHLKKIGPKPEEPGEVLAEQVVAGQVVAGQVVAEPGGGADTAEPGAEPVTGGAKASADVKSTGE